MFKVIFCTQLYGPPLLHSGPATCLLWSSSNEPSYLLSQIPPMMLLSLLKCHFTFPLSTWSFFKNSLNVCTYLFPPLESSFYYSVLRRLSPIFSYLLIQIITIWLFMFIILSPIRLTKLLVLFLTCSIHSINNSEGILEWMNVQGSVGAFPPLSVAFIFVHSTNVY